MLAGDNTAIPATREITMTHTAEPLGGRREIEVIAVIGFAHGVSHFFHLLLPPLFPWLMQDFSLSFTEVGLLTAVFFVISGVGQAAAGFLVDRIGARRALLAGILLFVAAAVNLSMAQSYAALMVTAALAGLGNCVFHPADFTVLNRRISGPRLGHAFSVHGLSGNLGWAAAPVFLTGITLAAGWRTAALAAGGLALLAAALVFWRRHTISDVDRHAPATEEPKAATFAFLGSVPVWMCFAFFFFATMAFGALQNYAPSVMQHLYGLSLVAGASSLTLFLLGGAAGMIVGGFVAGRHEAQERVIAFVLTAAALCAVIIASTAIPSMAVLPLMTVMGFFGGIAGPTRDMLVRRAATARFGRAAFGRVYGFVYSGLDIGLAVAPLIFGPLMDRARFAAVMGVVAISQALAIVAALGVGRTRAATTPTSTMAAESDNATR
jgi:MFS transporter, FSR family, fosmidomycin resistance protein